MVSAIRKTNSTAPPGPVKRRRRSNDMPSRMSARARAAIERTRRARAERDAIIAQADMSDLRDLPAVVIVGPPRKRVDWKKRSDYDVDEPTIELEPHAQPPIAPPVDFYLGAEDAEPEPAPTPRETRPARVRIRTATCSVCGKPGHNRRSCRSPARALPADRC